MPINPLHHPPISSTIKPTRDTSLFIFSLSVGLFDGISPPALKNMDRQDKEEYFRSLYALGDSSDEEKDTNDTREVIKAGVVPTSSSFTSSSDVVHQRRTQQLKTRKQLPTFHRTTSAPVFSAAKDTPAHSRKSSLLRYDISTPEINDSSFQNVTAPEAKFAKGKPENLRSASTPNIGTLFMQNSTGINSMLSRKKDTMLNKKRKRKDSSLELVPESDRIFAGQTFFYIPPDDKAPVRRFRITKARNFGVMWTKEWVPSITHIVVDKALTYSDVMKFLKPIMNADAIPPSIVLVNEDYPIDCTQHISILDPKQQKYAVSGFGNGPEKSISPRETSPESNKSFQVKQTRSKKWDDPPEKQTPSRSQSQSQLSLLNGDAESSPGVWLLPKESEEPGFVQSPKETTPPVNDHSRSLSESAQPPPLGLISGLGDALDQAISEAKKYQHLPLDDEDDENESRPSSSESNRPEDSDDSERDRSPIRAPKKTKYKKKGAANQENFSCMHGGTGVAVESNPNGVTISILQEMADYYERTRDKWRSFSYRKAIGTLKKQSQKIRYYDEAIVLPHVGHRIATKIEEIAATNRLRRLDNVKLEPVDIILQAFTKIYGADISMASKWIQAGLKTLDDLKTRGKLTKNQRIGLDHYEDFNTQIPREEVTALGEIVKKAAGAIDPEVQAIIGGSYRRGAKLSGDIDFILTKPGTSSSHQLLPFLAELVNRLTKDGFLVAALAEPRSLREGAKWHGACVLPGNPIWRRIDFLVVPETEFGAALIYFTGDDLFNRSMRLLSKTKGMRLNQRGLYKNVMRGPAGVKLTEGVLVEGADEKEIFKLLDVPWRPPEQRICH